MSEFAEYDKADVKKARSSSGSSFVTIDEVRKLGQSEIKRVRAAGLESWKQLQKSNLFPRFQTPPEGYLRACYCGCYITVENGDQYQTKGGIRGYTALYLTPFDKLPVKILDDKLKPFYREVVRYGQEPEPEPKYVDPDDPDRVFEQAGVISTASFKQTEQPERMMKRNKTTRVQTPMREVSKVLASAGVKHRLVIGSLPKKPIEPVGELVKSLKKALIKLPGSKRDELWRHGVTLDGVALRLDNDLRFPNKQLWQMSHYFQDLLASLTWLKTTAKCNSKLLDSDIKYAEVCIDQGDNCTIIGEVHADLVQLASRVHALSDTILKHLETTSDDAEV